MVQVPKAKSSNVHIRRQFSGSGQSGRLQHRPLYRQELLRHQKRTLNLVDLSMALLRSSVI